MSQINRPPIGLQGLLGSKNFGVNPSDLAQQVVPTVDLLPFWGSQVLKIVTQTGVSAGVGTLIQEEVPDDKTWAIVSACFTCEVRPTNDDCTLSIQIVTDLTAAAEKVTVAVSEFYASHDDELLGYATYSPPNLFWIPSGYGVTGVINSAAAAQVRDFSLELLVYEVDQ